MAPPPNPPATARQGVALALNLETGATMLVVALLSWVGLTTHQGSVLLEVVNSRLDIYTTQHMQEVARLERIQERGDGEREKLRVRVRALELGGVWRRRQESAPAPLDLDPGVVDFRPGDAGARGLGVALAGQADLDRFRDQLGAQFAANHRATEGAGVFAIRGDPVSDGGGAALTVDRAATREGGDGEHRHQAD